MHKKEDFITGESVPSQQQILTEKEMISIMTDPDLHPLPITPNDPLLVFSGKYGLNSTTRQKPAQPTPEEEFDMEILNSESNPHSIFETALPSLKLGSNKQPETPPKVSHKATLKPLQYNSGSKVVETMPEETKKEITQNNLATLKLQNRLSQMSIGTPAGLGLTKEQSSVSMMSD